MKKISRNRISDKINFEFARCYRVSKKAHLKLTLELDELLIGCMLGKRFSSSLVPANLNSKNKTTK